MTEDNSDSNAQMIRAWRSTHPDGRITEAVLLKILGLPDLQDADLRNADLRGANLWGGLPIQAGSSGSGYLVPTPDGWRITIGCWADKTLDDLRDLIADRVEWPEAAGAERDRRRPMLAAVLALCEAHIDQQPAGIITDLAAKWKELSDERM